MLVRKITLVPLAHRQTKINETNGTLSGIP